MRNFIFAALIAILFGTMANATSFDFSYFLSATGKTTTGRLEGTVLSDNNTVALTGIQAVSLNGVAITNPLSVVGTDALYGFGSAAPSFKLDKSFVNFTIFDPATNEILAFLVGDAYGIYSNGQFLAATNEFGGKDQYYPFIASNFSARLSAGAVVAAEPATWAMMVGGFGLIGVAARRRRRAGFTPARSARP